MIFDKSAVNSFSTDHFRLNLTFWLFQIPATYRIYVNSAANSSVAGDRRAPTPDLF